MKTPEIPSPVPNPEALAQLDELAQAITLAEAARAELKSAIEAKDEVKQAAAMAKLRPALAQGRGLRRKLEGDKSSTTITVEYQSETIELDFESSLSGMIELYQKFDIEIPPNFSDQMREIWERNGDFMKEAVAEQGFNQVLLIPENLPALGDLETKLTKGYEKEKGNKTYWWVKPEEIKEERTGARIVLVHHDLDLTAQPELNQTLGQTAEDLIKRGETLTLSEYLILQRAIFDQTGKHLDEKGWTWLPGSQLGDGQVVRAVWNPGAGRLHVDASSAGHSRARLGCRLSRQFS